MGAVYRAIRLSSGQEVAVKILEILQPDPEQRTRAEARFLQEASLLKGLSHPHTVRVYDYGTEDGQPWLAMELVRGPSMRQALSSGPMEPLRVVRIVRQVCGALAETHALGLVHRDLKPANILLAEGPGGTEQPKVVDYGLVKRIEGGPQLTAAGLLVGTPMFMSPEQVRGGQDLDQRSDLYGLGVLLYRALTGAYPFDHKGTADVLLAHLSEDPAPFPSVPPIPVCLQQVVASCLVKERGARTPSVGILSKQLAICEAVLLGQLEDEVALPLIAVSPEDFQIAEQTRAPILAAPVGGLALPGCLLLGAGLGLCGGIGAVGIGVAVMYSLGLI
ncbi:MAG TPA: serine/threonine protein kinase [Deltaproteobacteria bacterium]|nr:serine/threonine protein kinase [Deltaproteobacteria bacterium]